MPDTAGSRLDYFKRHMFLANGSIQIKDFKNYFCIGWELELNDFFGLF